MFDKFHISNSDNLIHFNLTFLNQIFNAGNNQQVTLLDQHNQSRQLQIFYLTLAGHFLEYPTHATSLH